MEIILALVIVMFAIFTASLHPSTPKAFAKEEAEEIQVAWFAVA